MKSKIETEYNIRLNSKKRTTLRNLYIFITVFTSVFFTIGIYAEENYFCAYGIVDTNFYSNILEKSANRAETFDSIYDYFQKHKKGFYRYEFKHLLRDKKHAQIFVKVLAIKAQEAHRFVPPIQKSEFQTPCHLGFVRHIKIEGGGPVCSERVLVNPHGSRVIFLEEWCEMNSSIEPGSFAAMNGIIKEKGKWYFTGEYLYSTASDEREVQARKKMFNQTYQKMLAFIEKEDVEKIYCNLKKFREKENRNNKNLRMHNLRFSI